MHGPAHDAEKPNSAMGAWVARATVSFEAAGAPRVMLQGSAAGICRTACS